MINFFLTDVLGFQALDEVKTEYMIKGTYADYVVQLNGVRHFLVEVKAYSLELSEKHLRQTVNYGANEGIEWALLTNGRSFDFYKILFNKPIESRKVFSIDLTNVSNYKSAIEYLQYIHRDAIVKKSRFINKKEITNAIKKLIKSKYNEKCDDEELRQSLNRLVLEKINPEQVKPYKSSKKEKTPKKEKVANLNSAVEHVIEQIVENTNPDSPILS